METPEQVKFSSQLEESFFHHLMEPSNQRIFFSGKFGIGKTYFLKHFFKTYSEKLKVKPIFISPVNYSIAENADIFALIKVDILKGLYDTSEYTSFLHNIQEQKPKFLKTIGGYAKSSPMKILGNLSKALGFISPFGDALNNITDGVSNLIADFKAFEEEHNKSYDADTNLKEFYTSFRDEEGTYLENNIITSYIHEILNSTSDCTKILIVDDIDRLDPKHVFRILNVLSSHFDDDSKEFKFGFDKIVLVGYTDNLKNLFQHFYGKETDFDGYFDKFTSIHPFELTNDGVIDDYLSNSFGKTLDKESRSILKTAIKSFFPKGISFRQVIKSEPVEIKKVVSWHKYNGRSVKIEHDKVVLLMLLDTLQKLYGGRIYLDNKLNSDYHFSIPFSDNLLIRIFTEAALLIPGEITKGGQDLILTFNLLNKSGIVVLDYQMIDSDEIKGFRVLQLAKFEMKLQMQMQGFVQLLKKVLEHGYLRQF